MTMTTATRPAGPSAIRQPNILFILTDQQRVDTLSSYGRAICQTPHLDRLATESVQFDRAYCVTPVCTPARASLQTGLYPSRHGMQNNIYYPGCLIHELADSPRLLSRQLARVGYTAGFTGKWHLGFGRDKPDNLEWRRHEAWNDWPDAWRTTGTLPSDVGYRGDDFPGHGGGGHDYPGYRAYLQERGFVTDVADKFTLNDEYGRWIGSEEATVDHFLVNRSLGHIEQFQAENRPWFFMLNFWGPHAPCFPPQRFLDLYEQESIPPWASFADNGENGPSIHNVKRGADSRDWPTVERALKRHYAHVSAIDEQIGRLLAGLRRMGVYDDTVVIFSADHGDSFGIHGGLMDKSFFMFEEAVRVPLYVKPAGAVSSGAARRDDRFVNTTDLYSTVLDLAGVPRALAERDGRSLVPVLRGEAIVDWPEQVVVESSGLAHTMFCQRMIRVGDLKYVFNCGDSDELYDLAVDPKERCNRIDDEAYVDRLAAMREALSNWLNVHRDPLFSSYERMRLKDR